jgi:hypothetical protein
VDPSYQVKVFRAGKYRVQPHAEVFQALQSLGIPADSSVWHGGWSFEHRFDFRNACSTMTPYFPSASDINLPAPPAEEVVMEFPILSVDGQKFSWMLNASGLWNSFRSAGKEIPVQAQGEASNVGESGPISPAGPVLVELDASRAGAGGGMESHGDDTRWPLDTPRRIARYGEIEASKPRRARKRCVS